MVSQLGKCEAFAALHRESGAWIIPNPWDVGSAKLLAGLGFRALATTSGGYAFTQGKRDGEVSLEDTLQHCAALCAATDVPISADFEDGYAEDLSTMATNIKRLAETGVAGFSIEDFNRERREIYPIAEAVERILIAAATIAETGLPLVLTARAEGLLRGNDDLAEIVQRLQAYSEAGAEVLFAPAINALPDLRTVTRQLNKPFNVLASFLKDASVKELAEAGAKRISVGGALTYASMHPIMAASREMLERGTFNWLSTAASGVEVRALMGIK